MSLRLRPDLISSLDELRSLVPVAGVIDLGADLPEGADGEIVPLSLGDDKSCVVLCTLRHARSALPADVMRLACARGLVPSAADVGNVLVAAPGLIGAVLTGALDRTAAAAGKESPGHQRSAALQEATKSYFGSAQETRGVFDLPHDFSERDFDELLLWAEQRRASDLTIQSGDFIFAQIQGLWQAVTTRRLEHNEVERIVMLKYGETGVTKMDAGVPLDFRLQAVITRDNVLGFRANATRCRVGPIQRGISITARSIPGLPPQWDILKIEKPIEDAFFPRYGLILVVGTTGSGKSTLMASSIRRRLEGSESPVKVITYEDPVEYTFGELGLKQMPMVSQAEIGVGSDLYEFALAGPNAMRRKADVIIMGEMRDMVSIRAGLEMAETGHAVMATLHVDTPAQAVDRIVSFFPEVEQPAVASKLRGALRVIVAQKLAMNTKGTRSAYRSWVVFDRTIKNLLGDTPFHDWQRLLAKFTAEQGADFESRCFPDLVSGLITFQTFCEVSGLTAAEGAAYCQERGLDGGFLD